MIDRLWKGLQPLRLSFDSLPMERAYRLEQMTRLLSTQRVALLLSVLIHVAYIPIDAIVLVDEFFVSPWGQTYRGDEFVGFLRLCVFVPLSLAIVWASYMEGFLRYSQQSVAFAVLANGLLWATAAIWLGPGQSMYFTPGTAIVCIYGCVISGLRFFWAGAVALVLMATNIATLLQSEISAVTLINALEILLFASGIAIVGAYANERLSRRAFLIEHARSEEAQRRIAWLEQLARFLRHELKTPLAGISSSFAIIERKSTEPPVINAASRGSSRVDVMRDLISNAVAAADLESALVRPTRCLLDVAETVEQLVVDCQSNARAMRVSKALRAETCMVVGNETLLQQAIGNLIANATEHGYQDSPIDIVVSDAHGRAEISVSNRCARFDAEQHAYPDPGRSGLASDDHFGLGLFIVRSIVDAHSGDLVMSYEQEAETLTVVIRLPLAGTGSDRTATLRR